LRARLGLLGAGFELLILGLGGADFAFQAADFGFKPVKPRLDRGGGLGPGRLRRNQRRCSQQTADQCLSSQLHFPLLAPSPMFESRGHVRLGLLIGLWQSDLGLAVTTFVYARQRARDWLGLAQRPAPP
jgi:hypothetical protein